MSYYLTIAFGGALGAMGRYWLTTATERYNSGFFPVGTFLVNLLGSLLIGIVFVILAEKIQLAAHLRPLVMIGFLGAFTTFSTFSIDALLLLQQGFYTTAVTYIAVSVAGCILAAWVGIYVTRMFI